MRPTLVFALLLLGLTNAAPEPEYASPLSEKSHAWNPADAPIEIESSLGRTDRLTPAALEPHILRVEVLKPEGSYALDLTSASADVDIPLGNTQSNNGADQAGQPSLDDLCNALFASAQNNDLPVPFFANLLWQESRLRADDVSKKGAKGIAQFMPEAAVETGLTDPFDPMQAIPASARFLQKLRMQFGNLGFVAAAYNAGAHRVIEWLENRASLPRETRVYVVRVTGLSVDTWRSMPINNDTLTFAQHLPCRSLPAFANVEQEHMQQMQQTQLEHVNDAQDISDDADDETAAAAPREHPAQKAVGDNKHTIEGKHTTENRHTAENKHGAESKHANEAKHERARNEVRDTGHDRRPVKREAAHTPHGAREKHKSA